MNLEKGMLLSTDMVRAVLDDRKNMTRRLKGLNEINESPEDWHLVSFEKNPTLTKIGRDGEEKPYVKKGLIATFQHEVSGAYRNIKCPWEPGDILWFRETYTVINGEIFYFADGYPDIELHDRLEQPKSKKIKWKPSLFMPRNTARLFGDIQNIRIERLQDITEEDARSEGVKGIPVNRSLSPIDDYIYPFKRLWDKLNSESGWDKNPWVWVIEFERVEVQS
jgi:hypothetical protein